MKSKIWHMILVFVVTVLVLSACTPPATATPTAAPKPTDAPKATEAPKPVEVPTEAPKPTEVPTEAPKPTEVPAPASDIDCTGVNPGDKITVMYQWSGGEEEKINAIFKPFVDACGVQIVAESSRDAAVLDTKAKSTPPDLLFWPTTAPLNLYAGQLKDLSTLGAKTENFADYWVSMGSKDGKWMAIPVKADIKSIIWYSPAQFEAFGYTVPTTFEDLDALVEKMVADGNVPWSMGMESAAATGWTGSDFVQDLLLAQQGPEYVNDLISGKVAYNDAGVLAAYQTYSKWASDAKYTVGGAQGTVSTPFLDAIYKVFQEKPEAMMVKQSGFAGGEVTKKFADLQYGTDFDFFAFPGIKGLQGGADFMMAFSESPATKAMVAYLTSAKGAETWATSGFDLCPNNLSTGKYTDTQLIKKAEALHNAAGFTPDLGDTIPAPFGETEWKAVIVAAQAGDIQAALDTTAKAQAEALK